MKRNNSSSESSKEKTTEEKKKKKWIDSSLIVTPFHSAFGIKFFLISLLRQIFPQGEFITVRTLPMIS